jgi:hypothetical protein
MGLRREGAGGQVGQRDPINFCCDLFGVVLADHESGK